MAADTNIHSFETLVGDLSPALGRYLLRQVRDTTLAEDLLQETLLRVARGLPSFDGRASVKSWAYAIANNIVRDHFRRSARLGLGVELAETEELADDACSVDEGIAIAQMNTCVREVVDALPEAYRTAVQLHDFNGMSARETAAACGCTEANAKVRIHRGRLRLRQALERECELYRDADNVLRCHRKESGNDDG